MNEYRCTRFRLYQNEGCPGYTDRRSRQGYYIEATSNLQAMLQMAKEFPNDIQWGIRVGEEPFTSDLWKEHIDTTEVIHHG